MKVKVSFGSDIRIWRTQDRTFASLRAFVENSFDQLNDDFLLTYDDDEGDQITIADDEGLEEAVEVAADLGRKSLKIRVIFLKRAQRIEEPGALEPDLSKGEEIVSEPGGGLQSGSVSQQEVSQQEEELDALDVDFLDTATPRRTDNSKDIQSDQVEGAQSIAVWIKKFMPILNAHGIGDEIKSGIPIFMRSLDNGDDIGTALQTMIAQCHLLQTQEVVQEFMNHVQHNVAPLSDEIVPHILTFGESGLNKMANHFLSVSQQWANGIPDINVDVTPFLSMIWPGLMKRMQQSGGGCDFNLASISLGRCMAAALSPKRTSPPPPVVKTTEVMDTPYNVDDTPPMEKEETRFRIAAREDEYSSRRDRDWKNWRGNRHSGRRRGYGSHRRGRGRGRNPAHHDFFNLPPHPPHFYSSQSTPYYTNGYEDDFYKSMSWDPATKVHPHRYSGVMRGLEHNRDSRYDHPIRRSANRLEATQQPDMVRISATPLKADFVDHVNIPLRSKYLPNQTLLKKWCVRNVGRDDWDSRVHLEFTKGDEQLPTRKRFDVNNCLSGELCELSAMIQTPQKPGRYTSYFRLVRDSMDPNSNGTFFGPRIWVDVHVVATQEELSQDEEQTKKRLKQMEDRVVATRSSQTRNSAKRIRNTSRRKSKKKTDDPPSHIGGGLGMVSFPMQRPSNRNSTSKLNSNAETFVPKSSQETYRSKTSSPYDSLIDEIHNMGFICGRKELVSLFDAHQGDMNRVINTLVERNVKEAAI